MSLRSVWLGAFLAFAAAPASAAGGELVRITAVGDINLGSDFPTPDSLPPDGGAKLLEPVRELLRGDVVFGNLEGPLLDGGESLKCRGGGNCFAFRTPTAYGPLLRAAGFTVLGLANNHALDFGDEGRASSTRVLDALGIAHSGTPGDLARLEVKGKKLVLVAFTSSEHSYNLLDLEGAARTVAALAKEHDLVIVSFHAGAEGAGAAHVPDGPEFLGLEPRGHLVQFAHAVIDAGADLVLGHGPHLMRGLEQYRGRLIAYSLGNFCTYGRFSLQGPLGRAGVLQVDLDADSGAFVGGRLVSTLQEKPGGPRLDPSSQTVQEVRALSAADFPFSAPVLGEDGALTPGAGEGAGLFLAPSAEARSKLLALLAELERRGFQRDELRRWFGDARAALAPKVLEKFARPAEKALTYAQYRNIFMQPERLEAGKRWLEEQRTLLDTIEAEYGVDRAALAGIIATETKFGLHPLPFRAFDALVTQALEMPRRAKWARGELAALLRVFRDDPLRPSSSYAGAVGLVQFMPSSIERHARDGDGDGKIDLEQWPDALASAANYLKAYGWKQAQPILPGSPNAKAIWGYNPAGHYVKVVTELSEAFGMKQPAKKPEKKSDKSGKKN